MESGLISSERTREAPHLGVSEQRTGHWTADSSGPDCYIAGNLGTALGTQIEPSVVTATVVCAHGDMTDDGLHGCTTAFYP